MGDGEYFVAVLPDGSRLVHAITRGEKHPLNFGREVCHLSSQLLLPGWRAPDLSPQSLPIPASHLHLANPRPCFVKQRNYASVPPAVNPSLRPSSTFQEALCARSCLS